MAYIVHGSNPMLREEIRARSWSSRLCHGLDMIDGLVDGRGERANHIARYFDSMVEVEEEEEDA